MEVSNEVLVNIMNALAPWWGAVHRIGIFIGLCLIVGSIYNLAKSNRNTHSGNGYILMGIAGLMLINQGAGLDSLSLSVFEETSRRGIEDLAGASSSGQTRFQLIINLSLMIVMLVGAFGYIQGFIMLARSKRDSGALGPAIAFIIGGMLAVNIDTLILSGAMTVGGDFYNNVTQYISD